LKKCVPQKCFWKSSLRPSAIAWIGMPLVFVVINLTVDLMYYAVDPRLRIERIAAAA